MAYYSRLRPAVYHKYKNCHVGDNMVEGNLRRGKPPGANLCQICARLGAAGTGILGIPKLPRLQIGAKVKTYYSSERPQIFHICQNCFLGQNIEDKYLAEGKPKPVKGRDGKTKKPRLCQICTRLCIGGECMTGTPIPAGKRKPTKAYYSKAYPRPKIYHVCQNCNVGNNIEAKYLVAGKPPGAKLCQNCARLRKKGKCIRGIPTPAGP
jgi:hypothetical protein